MFKTCLFKAKNIEEHTKFPTMKVGCPLGVVKILLIPKLGTWHNKGSLEASQEWEKLCLVKQPLGF